MINLKDMLDITANYKVTKIGVKDDDNRFVQVGDEHVGPALVLYGRLVVGDLITSQVVSFSQYKNNFVIETKNSTYSLEKL